MTLVADFFNNIVDVFITGAVLVDTIPVVPDGAFYFSFELASVLFMLKPEVFGTMRFSKAKEFPLLTKEPATFAVPPGRVAFIMTDKCASVV